MAMRHIWGVTLRYLRAVPRQPAWVAISLIQPEARPERRGFSGHPRPLRTCPGCDPQPVSFGQPPRARLVRSMRPRATQALP
jgi:hypothetical protein